MLAMEIFHEGFYRLDSSSSCPSCPLVLFVGRPTYLRTRIVYLHRAYDQSASTESQKASGVLALVLSRYWYRHFVRFDKLSEPVVRELLVRTLRPSSATAAKPGVLDNRRVADTDSCLFLLSVLPSVRRHCAALRTYRWSSTPMRKTASVGMTAKLEAA